LIDNKVIYTVLGIIDGRKLLLHREKFFQGGAQFPYPDRYSSKWPFSI